MLLFWPKAVLTCVDYTRTLKSSYFTQLIKLYCCLYLTVDSRVLQSLNILYSYQFAVYWPSRSALALASATFQAQSCANLCWLHSYSQKLLFYMINKTTSLSFFYNTLDLFTKTGLVLYQFCQQQLIKLNILLINMTIADDWNLFYQNFHHLLSEKMEIWCNFTIENIV